MPAQHALERFVQTFNRRRDGLRCDRCRTVLHRQHRHLIELAAHQLLCACNACASEVERSVLGPYRLIPEAVRSAPEWAPSWERWDSFGMPLRLGFFLWLSRLARWAAVAPSPAGAVNVELPTSAWSAYLRESGIARQVRPDVEALLVRGAGGGPLEAYVVPLDLCYELVALVRQTWRGIDGGDAARGELDRYFERLRQRSTEAPLAHAAGQR
ncbi:MAG TPA: DUF5947 family protein [Polyangiaceae bacterium]|jgi:hypothetical protein|nr:DUF5947 family protein [Polyangiaceae bacterium]